MKREGSDREGRGRMLRAIRHVTAFAFALLVVPSHAQPAPDVVRTSLYVPVRDGTRLAVNIYRPAFADRPVAGRMPVIFAFTPYRARYRADDGRVVELALSD